MLLRSNEVVHCVIRHVDLATAGGVMSQGNQPTPIVVAREVQDNRTQICRSAVDIVDAPRVTGEAQEGLLHNVFRSLSIIDEQARQANEGTPLKLEEMNHHLLG